MDQSIVEMIAKEKIPCSFISPHLDDVALSCGGLLSYLSSKTKVRVVTVFTEASSGLGTLSGKAYLRQCGFKDAGRMYKERKKEDRKTLEKLGIEAVHLGFQDALWRKKGGLGWLERKLAFFMPEFAYIYPTYRFHIISGLVDSRDASLLENIEKDLLRLFRDKDKIIIFSPLALGDHVDHVIVRDIVSKMFGQAIFWSDFPYNLEKKKEKGSFAEKNDLKPFSWENLPYGKIKLISSYKTQIKAMFPKGIPVIPEEYFVKAES